MADAKLIGNLAAIKARVAKLQPTVQAAIRQQLKTEADGLVDAIKTGMDAAYAGSSDDAHAHLRDSVHAYANPDREISYRILADAKDADGEFIGSHVEAGHRAVDGTHVAANPVFFPVYRSQKSKIKRRVSAAARKAVRALFPEG